MSEGQPEAIELPSGDAAFSSLMDALAPEPADGSAAPDGAAEGAAPAGSGSPAGEAGGAAAPSAPAGTPDPAAAGTGGTPAAGAAAADGGAVAGGDQPGGADTGGAAALPDAGTGAGAGAGAPAGDGAGVGGVEATLVIPEFGKLSVALEDKVAETYQAAALEEVRGEHEQYFTALEQHPRVLVGTQVPAIGKEGMETIQSTEDARDWQDAVKNLLVAEVRERAVKEMEANSTHLSTLHSSIELFQNNPDLIPGTKGFNRALADRFATMLKPYELRGDDKKLNGYSIPVQPIVDQLREQLKQEAASTPAPVAPSTPASAPGAAAPAAPADPPQAGIPSKTGSSAEVDDMSTFWGTLGLPDIRL